MKPALVSAPPAVDPTEAGRLCTRVLTVVRRDTPLPEAARRMRDEHVGCVVVADPSPTGDVAAGLLTDRDIVVAVVALGLDPSALLAEDVMTAPLVTVPEHASHGAVLALMREHGVRRVPVVSAGGAVVGLLSFDDLVAALTLLTQAMTDTLVAGRQKEGSARPGRSA
ncbi:MAG TPA: CBS domain-containing protein, partial [Burkholderiaceae bacterium]